MTNLSRGVTLALVAGLLCQAQTPKSATSPSTIRFSGKPGSETLEITNSSYAVTAAFLPGRPPEQRLVLKTTSRHKQVMDEMGSDSSVTLDAWPFGANLNAKPLYSLSVSGSEGRIVDGVLFQVARGLEDVEWWSVYQTGTGRHLFDTHVPIVGFSISRAVLTRRYVGLEVPPDDVSDARLKEPRVVGILSYSSAERVIREVLITCDDPQRARLLRSYFDAIRSVSLLETAGTSPEPSQALQITFREAYPGKGDPLSIRVPIAQDTLNLAEAQLPKGLHLAVWKR
jgi:hypothetical protein